MENTNYDDLAASVGFTATVALMTWFEGRRLHVPRQVLPQHPLATLIGLPALRALVRDFGGEDLWLPASDQFGRYARNRDIAVRLAAGDTPAQIAERFGLSERRVEQIRVELVDAGLLKLAEGRRLPSGPGRPARGRRSPFGGLKILGTGEVSDEPPPPC